MRRLARGGRIDRNRPVGFSFDGKAYTGYIGDTLASALLANGVRLVARSFKYHRPRGVLTAGGEEPNALVQINSSADRAQTAEPNVRATTLKLSPGLDVSSVNCWPGLAFDVGAINSKIAPLLPAGFYYKTFMLGPWDRYARLIRRAAGIGRLPGRPAALQYEKRYAHTDVLVVGAGPAGISSAVQAANTGARVTLVDNQDEPGGHLLNTGDDDALADCAQQILQNLQGSRRINYLPMTTATGYYDHNLVVCVEQQPEDAPWIHERLWHIRAGEVILATGAAERPLVFANNDRPGLMLASAAATYVNRYGVAPGSKAVVFTNNSSAYPAAFDLHDAGVEVAAIVDARSDTESQLRDASRARGIPVYVDSLVVNAKGKMCVTHATIAPRKTPDRTRDQACDLLCVSGGWNPLVQLQSHTGAKPVYDSNIAAFVPGPSVMAERSVGGCAGEFDRGSVPYSIDALWHASGARHRGKAFVDYQNDVTASDIALALRENFQSIEHVKRYTTAGMATDQGKIGNANVIGLVSELRGTAPDAIGTTTFRPPYTPVSFGALGGADRNALILPFRTTPITPWNLDRQAVMNEAGANFRRPFWFPKKDEPDLDAINRAARAVRTGVGIYDATPLGKFELHGPDVPELLNRLYTNRFDTLQVGEGRFGLMLREDGRLLDDGVTFRLDDHWLMTCGTGAAGAVLQHIDRLLQTEWQDLRVYLVNVTSQWSNICVCGPNARDVLHAAGTRTDIGSEFRFMQIKEAVVAGFTVRLARVSYTGELSFELNIRRREALALWETLIKAGEEFDITPVGSETSAVLRIEKGFISAGTEGDNITNPWDAGLGWIVDLEKDDFIGKRTLLRDRALNIPRQHVVGLLPESTDYVVAEGSALLPRENSTAFQGHVTASCYSPTLERPIALALLKNGKQRHGERILISGLDRSVWAEVTRPVFYDPKGLRMRA